MISRLVFQRSVSLYVNKLNFTSSLITGNLKTTTTVPLNNSKLNLFKFNNQRYFCSTTTATTNSNNWNIESLLSKLDYKSSIESLNEIIKANENDSLGYRTRGHSFAKMGDLDKAINDYQSCLKITPNSVPTLHSLAFVYMEKFQFDKAQSLLKEIIKIDPNYYSAYAWLGEIELSNFNDQKAKEYFQEALAKDENNEEALVGLSSIYLQNNDLEESIKLLERVVERYDLQKNVKQTKPESMQEKIDRAHAPYSKSIYYFAMTNLAGVYRLNHQMKESIAMFEKSLELENSTEILLTIAEIKIEEGEPTQAMEYIDKAKSISPNDPAIVFMRANTLYSIQRLEEALQDYDLFTDKLVRGDDIKSLIKRIQIYSKKIDCLLFLIHGTKDIVVDDDVFKQFVRDKPFTDIVEFSKVAYNLYGELLLAAKNPPHQQIPFLKQSILLALNLVSVAEDSIKLQESVARDDLKYQYCNDQLYSIYYNAYDKIMNKIHIQ
ncbi:hypothetical protein CYY_007699 [Polysphondylium violaceum]|uniref:TPR-like protein n=1 Tax=Polysphondylium violaceum TaxID=133409 RepID=A0A8J4PNY2_9MYCE|nr:hypothetical protein CYY_007699 [Polysphondylium violaceum]